MKTIIATIAILAAAVGFGDTERQANQSWVLHKIDEVVGTNTAALVANATNDTLKAAKDYTDEHGGAVKSVNGKTGEVQLGAADVGAVPLVKDQHGEKTAVTIGTRRGMAGMFSLAHGSNVSATEYYSHAEGENTSAYGYCSHSEGESTTASGDYSRAEGIDSKTEKDHAYAFAWNGDSSRSSPYTSHGPGTFNINPAGGLDGFWFGEQTLASIMSDKADEFTEWEFSGDKSEGVSYSMSRVSSPVRQVGRAPDS